MRWLTHRVATCIFGMSPVSIAIFFVDGFSSEGK